jgi:hypothetical protein
MGPKSQPPDPGSIYARSDFHGNREHSFKSQFHHFTVRDRLHQANVNSKIVEALSFNKLRHQPAGPLTAA